MNKNGFITTNRKELKLKIVDISIAEKDVFNSFEMLSDGMSSNIKVSIIYIIIIEFTRFVLCSLTFHFKTGSFERSTGVEHLWRKKLNLTELKILYRRRDQPRIVESESNNEEKVEKWLNCFSKDNKPVPQNKNIKTSVSVHLP